VSATRPKRNTRGAWRIFAIPLGLGTVSLAGLVAALLTDGPIDLLWTLAIAAPLIAILKALSITTTGRQRKTQAENTH